MEKLALSLGPALIAGFAIQRLLELVDALFSIGSSGHRIDLALKRVVLGLLSIAAGLAMVFGTSIRVLEPLGAVNSDYERWLDVFATTLVISGGTEGANSLMKLLGYVKESQKGEAAARMAEAPPSGIAAVDPGASEVAAVSQRKEGQHQEQGN